MPHVRRIGILSGGGDCPGINAVIRAVTLDAIGHGIEVVGIRDGFLGLIEGRAGRLSAGDVVEILDRGGSILGCSNKANPSRFATGVDASGKPVFADVTPRCLEVARAEGIEALVCIGGDGTMTCAQSLVDPGRFGHAGPGLNCVGVPKTIDNDIVGCELTFGFLSAVAVAAEAMDRVRTTAMSHGRVIVVEVMGRNAGWLGLHAGIAGGADVVLLPEFAFDLSVVAEHIRRRAMRGERHSVVCVSEGARAVGGSAIVARVDASSPDPIRLGGVGKFVSDGLEATMGQECRYVVLGHVQRGGPPVAADRVLATRFGHHAMEVVRGGSRNRMVSWQRGRVMDVDIAQAAGRQRLVAADEGLIAAGRAVGVCFGA